VVAVVVAVVERATGAFVVVVPESASPLLK
jgi:hypothetical protein